MQEIAVVERLQPEILELPIARRLQGRGDPSDVETPQLRVDQLEPDAAFEISREILGIAGGHLRFGRLVGATGEKAQRLAPELVVEQPRRGVGITRLGFDQRTGGKDRRQRQLVGRDAVIEIAPCFGEDGFGDHPLEARRGLGDDRGEPGFVERRAIGHADGGGCGRRHQLVGTRLGMLLAVEHIGAGDPLVFAAHQRQLHLVLHVLDVEHPAVLGPSGERHHDFAGQLLDDLVHPARRGRLVALDGEKRLGQRHGNLRLIERHRAAIALDQREARLMARVRLRRCDDQRTAGVGMDDL